ncbi:hypothetical protein Pcinc_027377 [Petrolisthes cinctipes]|uniref:Uncharacterized protein n=1 Tax=Petrolisthes cinctipes TaxID=88211 RepID=A0AAE1F5A3_PETCI|nr:hypothetical protein Pcinc_027377 [Petrolisthes cinctipes]
MFILCLFFQCSTADEPHNNDAHSRRPHAHPDQPTNQLLTPYTPRPQPATLPKSQPSPTPVNQPTNYSPPTHPDHSRQPYRNLNHRPHHAVNQPTNLYHQPLNFSQPTNQLLTPPHTQSKASNPTEISTIAHTSHPTNLYHHPVNFSQPTNQPSIPTKPPLTPLPSQPLPSNQATITINTTIQ